MHRRPAQPEPGANQTALPTLPTVAYRGPRERAKAPLESRSSPGLPAVIKVSLPPTSPRLRNSRERQPLQPSPSPRAESSATPTDPGYFPVDDKPLLHPDAAADYDNASVMAAHIARHDHHIYAYDAGTASENPVQPNTPKSPSHHQRLSLQTSSLSLPPFHQPLSATTDFDESPVLGIPGSFVLTPPTVHQEPEHQLLQPAVFQGHGTKIHPASPDVEQSELGVRESIPIMLGAEQPQNREGSIGSLGEDVQSTPFSSHQDYAFEGGEPRFVPRYGLDDLAINVPPERRTLYPDDSASIGPYNALRSLTFDRETYSVVNSVLNMYHQSPVISAELASVSRERVQHVSPIIAQHKDWASKEATETYLARLLSDANGSVDGLDEQCVGHLRTPDSEHTEPELSVSERSGTAIIYPAESRRYSRGSAGSTTTTIQDDASHSGNSSENVSSDSHQPNMHVESSSPLTKGIELPQLAWTNGGLGLSLHNELPHLTSSQYAPPRPAYSPPPPPVKPSIEQQVAPLHDAYHSYPAARVALTDHQLEMHPARSCTPVTQAPEPSLEDRYGTPQPRNISDHELFDGDKGRDDQPDPAQQALIKRYRILEELLTTEHQFCIDMMIAHNIFEATAQNLMTEKEKKMLFSNCKELEKFSLSLFRAFKKAAKPVVNYEIPPPTGPWNRDPSDSRPYNPPDSSLTLRRPSEDAENQFETCTLENDQQTTIGQVFLENREKMERLYTTYFLNQDNASAYIKKNQNNSDLSGWVVACFEQVENMTQAWDLDSLLLKPCQRLLKYPLLLEGLLNSSDPDHPDLQNIKDARKELLAINARINDAKARSDTFRAAASEGKKEKSRGKGLGKTFVKAFIPKVDKNKAYDEADKAFKDQEYKTREQKFGGHFFQLQIVIRDFEQYLDSITEHYLQLNIVFLGFITVCEVAPSVHPEMESVWRKWAMAHFELQNKALEDHVSLMLLDSKHLWN